MSEIKTFREEWLKFKQLIKKTGALALLDALSKRLLEVSFMQGYIHAASTLSSILSKDDPAIRDALLKGFTEDLDIEIESVIDIVLGKTGNSDYGA